jgi:pimeloyl-ACP methyl ester carboxylesterase
VSEAHRWRSKLLGEPRTLELADGVLDYFERGEGPALLFSHGWLANANLWRKVVDRLHGEFRCLVLDLPLGSHRTPMALVGNDSGGAYSQIALANCEAQTAGRISGLVLTSCETPYDEWPPAPFDGLPEAARDPEVLGQLLAALEDPAVRAAPVAYGHLLKRPSEASDSYALPASRDPGVLRDVAKAMASATTAPVRTAGETLIARHELPTLLIWSEEDAVFPVEHAARYADALADARLVRIADSYSFTPEDQPEAVATAIKSFMTERMG